MTCRPNIDRMFYNWWRPPDCTPRGYLQPRYATCMCSLSKCQGRDAPAPSSLLSFLFRRVLERHSSNGIGACQEHCAMKCLKHVGASHAADVCDGFSTHTKLIHTDGAMTPLHTAPETLSFKICRMQGPKRSAPLTETSLLFFFLLFFLYASQISEHIKEGCAGWLGPASASSLKGRPISFSRAPVPEPSRGTPALSLRHCQGTQGMDGELLDCYLKRYIALPEGVSQMELRHWPALYGLNETKGCTYCLRILFCKEDAIGHDELRRCP